MVCVCEQCLSSVCVCVGGWVDADVWVCGCVCGVFRCDAYLHGSSVYIVCLYVYMCSCSYVNVCARVCAARV